MVTIVDVEELVEAVVTVVRAVGDVFIESARVIEVGETMAKMLVKVEQLPSGKLFHLHSSVKCVDFGNIFLDAMYNQIYFLTFYYTSDIQ